MLSHLRRPNRELWQQRSFHRGFSVVSQGGRGGRGRRSRGRSRSRGPPVSRRSDQGETLIHYEVRKTFISVSCFAIKKSRLHEQN